MPNIITANIYVPHDDPFDIFGDDTGTVCDQLRRYSMSLRKSADNVDALVAAVEGKNVSADHHDDGIEIHGPENVLKPLLDSGILAE